MTRREVKGLLLVELDRRADEIEREGSSPLTSDAPIFRTEAAELRSLEPGQTLPWWAMDRARAWGLM